MRRILRKTLLDKLFVLKDKNFIKIVTGVRRSGKSTLLLQFQELLKGKNPNASIISINNKQNCGKFYYVLCKKPLTEIPYIVLTL